MPSHFALLLTSSLVLLSGCGKPTGISMARTAAKASETQVQLVPESFPEMPVPTLRPIHRYYNTAIYRHLLTVNPPEVAELPASGGWVYEGISFYLYDESYGVCTRAIYRCHGAPVNAHFASVSPECEGYTNLGLLGYACTTPVGEMSSPVTRYYQRAVSDHVLANEEEGAGLARYPVWIKESQLNFGFVRLK